MAQFFTGATASFLPTPWETNRGTCVIASVAKSRRAQLQQRSLHLAAASQLGLNSSSAIVTRNGGNAVCTSNRLLAASLSKAPEGGPDFCALPRTIFQKKLKPARALQLGRWLVGRVCSSRDAHGAQRGAATRFSASGDVGVGGSFWSWAVLAGCLGPARSSGRPHPC